MWSNNAPEQETNTGNVNKPKPPTPDQEKEAKKFHENILDLNLQYNNETIEELKKTSKKNKYKFAETHYDKNWHQLFSFYFTEDRIRETIKKELTELKDNTIYICTIPGDNFHRMCAIKKEGKLFIINAYDKYKEYVPDLGANVYCLETPYTPIEPTPTNTCLGYPCCFATYCFIQFINEFTTKDKEGKDSFEKELKKAFESENSWYDKKASEERANIKEINNHITNIHNAIKFIEENKQIEYFEKLKIKNSLKGQIEELFENKTREWQKIYKEMPRSTISTDKNNNLLSYNSTGDNQPLLDTPNWLSRLKNFFSCCRTPTVIIYFYCI